MSEFIEIISEQTKAQIDAIMPLVDKLASKIKEINSFSPSNTPSGADKGIQNMNIALKEQATALNTVKTSLSQVNEQKAKSVSLTTQEKVDNAIILKQEKQKATLTSEYAKAYEKLNMQRTIAKQKLQDLIASEKTSNDEIRKAQKEFDILNKKVAAADKAVGRFSDANRKINGLTSSVGNLMTAFGIGTGLYLAVDIGKSIFNTTKELQSLNLALKMVSGTNQEYAENQSFVQQVSEKWGLEVKSLTQQYTQFYTASKGLLSKEAIKTTFEGIAKAGSVMGLSLEKQKDAFYAIDQMMSKGTVTAEELKKQLGNAMPGAIKAAAMAYMELHPAIKTIQEAEKGLYEAMKKGALDSATYVPLIVKNLNKIYGIEMLNKVDTLQANQNRLSNSWTEMVRSLNESNTGGLTKFFNFFTKGMTGMLQILTRFNDEWDEIYKKAELKGALEGKNIFENLMGGKKGEEAIKQAQQNIRLAKSGIDTFVQKIKDSQKELKDAENRSSGINLGKSTKQVKEELELLRSQKAQYVSLYNSSRDFLNTEKTSATPIVKTKTKAELKAELKLEKDAAKEREQLLKDQYDAELSNLTLRKEALSDHLKNEKNFNQEEISIFKFGTDEKKKYSMKLAQSEIAIAELVYKEKKRLAEKEIKDRNLTPKEAKNLMIPIDNEFAKSTADALQSSADRNIKIYENYYKELGKFADEQKDKKFVAKGQWTKEQVDIQGEFQEIILNQDRDWIKSLEEKDKAILASLNLGLNNAMLEKDEVLVKKYKELIEDFKETTTTASNYLNSFVDEFGSNMGLSTMFDIMNGGLEQFGDNWKAKAVMIMESAQEMYNFISNASQENFDKEYARLEKQKEVALAFAGDSDSAKKKIEEDYEKRRKEIAVREFKAKQKMAIVNIAIDTAQAVMAVSAKAQWWQVPLMIALGAVQAGIVASQKIPEYWKGTDSAEAGLAWTNERGAEIVTDKAGHIKDFGSNSGAKLTMMEKGDKVYTSEQTKKLMFNNDLNSIMMDNGIGNAPQIVVNSGITKAEIEDVMMKTLGSMSQESTIIDSNGFKRVISNGHSKTITNNNRVSGRGIRV